MREIKELLEKARNKSPQDFVEDGTLYDGWKRYCGYLQSIIFQALTKCRKATEQPPLREQPCGCILCVCDTEDRCLGCGAKMCEKHQKAGYLPKEEMVYPEVPEQPPAGEFTKAMRTQIIRYRKLVSPFAQDTIDILYRADELCDRLDTSEASRKDLLAALEEASTDFYYIHQADFDDPVPGSIFLRASAIIAKANKQGD